MHSCCDFCACDPTCDGKPSQMEKFTGKELASRQRAVSDWQKQLLIAKLEEMKDDLNEQGLGGGFAVYSTVHSTDDTHTNLVKEVIETCDCLFTLEDIFSNVSVSTIQQAQTILKVLGEIFEDILEDDYGDDDTSGEECDLGLETLNI